MWSWANIISAIGMAGLGLYQASTGDWSHAVQSFAAALAILGIHMNTSNSK